MLFVELPSTVGSWGRFSPMFPLRHQGQILSWLFRWLALSIVVGTVVGTSAAGFLFALKWAGETRGEFLPWLILGLGPAGAAVAWIYTKYGGRSEGGNNLIIEEMHEPSEVLPLRMAPLVVGGTLVSHVFGASAGREGTAVQMGAVLADQLGRPFRMGQAERRVLLAAGVAAGFAALFGTPLAGCVFGLEVAFLGGMLYRALAPTLFSALLADWMCRTWNAPHSHYEMGAVPPFSLEGFAWAALAGVAFGLCATLFSVSVRRLGAFLKSKLANASVRALVGGVAIGVLYLLFGAEYLGLGLPTIVRSFHEEQPVYSFAVKVLFTVVTLASGFKGGEVTPLFFIGATLGNALSFFIPGLPLGLLVAMGFVGVFAGAANTPIACILMAVELFGGECLSYVAVSCVVAFLVSGHTGIYSSQRVRASKLLSGAEAEGKSLGELDLP